MALPWGTRYMISPDLAETVLIILHLDAKDGLHPQGFRKSISMMGPGHPFQDPKKLKGCPT